MIRYGLMGLRPHITAKNIVYPKHAESSAPTATVKHEIFVA